MKIILLQDVKTLGKKRRCRRSQCGLCTEHDSAEKIRSRGNTKESE